MNYLLGTVVLLLAAGCGGGSATASEPADSSPTRSSPTNSPTANELAVACDRVAQALPADSYDTDAMAGFMTDLTAIANDVTPAARSELVGLVQPLNAYVSGGGPDAHREFLAALDQLAAACATAGSTALQ